MLRCLAFLCPCRAPCPGCIDCEAEDLVLKTYDGDAVERFVPDIRRGRCVARVQHRPCVKTWQSAKLLHVVWLFSLLQCICFGTHPPTPICPVAGCSSLALGRRAHHAESFS